MPEAIIAVGEVDVTDWIHFAGVNGQAGLNMASLTIPGTLSNLGLLGVGLFTYN